MGNGDLIGIPGAALIVGLTQLLCRTLTSTKTRSTLTILGYHRVLKFRDPLVPGFPTESDLYRQLSAAKDVLNVLPLADAIRELYDGPAGQSLGAITFDDGYQDNHQFALPILRALRLPATFFVSTAYLNGEPMFTDQLIEAIRRTRQTHLSIPELTGSPLRLLSNSDRQTAINLLLARLKYMNPERRDALPTKLATEMGSPPHYVRLMNPEELRDLVRNGHSIGAHSHRHVIMTTWGLEEVRNDLSRNVDILTSISGQPPTLLAYPNGRPDTDFTDAHESLAKQLGFSAAVSSSFATATKADSRFRLPRYTPWGGTRIECVARLLHQTLKGTRHQTPQGIST